MCPCNDNCSCHEEEEDEVVGVALEHSIQDPFTGQVTVRFRL